MVPVDGPFRGSDYGCFVAFPAASCARIFFQGIQIGPEFMSGHPRHAFDREHAKRRNFVPLRDGLCGNANTSSKLGLSAYILNRTFQSFGLVGHGKELKHSFT